MIPSERARGGPKYPEVKMVLLGDAGVGKSSLAQRFVSNNFKPYCETTIGASFMSKMMTVEGKAIKCQIWDTAGQEKYHSLAPMYYRGAQAAILVYDITSRASLGRLKEWASELQTQGPENIKLAVAGNKSDLETKRQVDRDEAAAVAHDIGALFVETSAKNDTNVSALFCDLAALVPIERGPDEEPPTIRLDARRQQPPKKTICGGGCARQ